MIQRLRASCLLVALVSFAAALSAQEGPVTFEFSFSNPGARSMGIGGAFAALADDATAAFANPAGLVQLLEPEVSIEGRLRSYDIRYVAGGRASGVPTGIGADTERGIRYGTYSTDVTGISFMSLVYPIDRWSLAVYRHQVADFTLASEVNGLFATVDDEIERSEDVVARTRYDIVNNGLAAAFRVNDRLSLGLGLVYYEADFSSISTEYTTAEGALLDSNPFLPELLDTTYSWTSTDSGLRLHAGFLWRPVSQWSVGGYFRQGPDLEVNVVEVAGPANEDEAPGTVELDTTVAMQLPDVFGLGVAYRSAGGALTVSFEWARVRYSSFYERFDGVVYDGGEVALTDGDELHLGFEYVLATSKPLIALRLGAWHDPAHGVGSGPFADELERAIFAGGEDRLHLCAGIGLVLDRFQVDLGVDLADTVDAASVSIVYRF